MLLLNHFEYQSKQNKGSVTKRPKDSSTNTTSGQTNGQMSTRSVQINAMIGQASTMKRQTNGQTSATSITSDQTSNTITEWALPRILTSSF